MWNIWWNMFHVEDRKSFKMYWNRRAVFQWLFSLSPRGQRRHKHGCPFYPSHVTQQSWRHRLWAPWQPNSISSLTKDATSGHLGWIKSHFRVWKAKGSSFFPLLLTDTVRFCPHLLPVSSLLFIKRTKGLFSVTVTCHYRLTVFKYSQRGCVVSCYNNQSWNFLATEKVSK